jgi:hypothetical protein
MNYKQGLNDFFHAEETPEARHIHRIYTILWPLVAVGLFFLNHLPLALRVIVVVLAVLIATALIERKIRRYGRQF